MDVSQKLSHFLYYLVYNKILLHIWILSLMFSMLYFDGVLLNDKYLKQFYTEQSQNICNIGINFTLVVFFFFLLTFKWIFFHFSLTWLFSGLGALLPYVFYNVYAWKTMQVFFRHYPALSSITRLCVLLNWTCYCVHRKYQVFFLNLFFFFNFIVKPV